MNVQEHDVVYRQAAAKAENRRFWDRVSQPPPSALKKIAGGRLKGMTDINPQWRLEVMTEVFGPCGIGWKYTIDKLWTEPGAEDETLVFALVSLYVEDDKGCSAPIPGIGGNKLVAQERNGIHNNDEAYKMAVTDALSVAMKALGVGAYVYAGLWDGNMYHHRPEFAVTQTMLNSLKKKWHESGDGLDQLDQPELQRRFSSWCKKIIGEDVDYHQPSAWNRSWLDTCVEALNGVSADVPFDAE